MAVLFCASEIYPYAKSGGLGDVTGSLPPSLRKYTTVYTIMPLYMTIDREKFEIKFTGLSFDYWLNGQRHQFDVFVKKDNKYELFIYNPILCDRSGLYNDSHGDFGDNALRFGLFSYGILETMIRLNLSIDVIHINDWQTALVAILAKTRYHLSQKIILTIHNLAYQGVFPKNIIDDLEIDWDICFKPNILEYHDNINLLKAAIFYSDEVTTVSPTYANEIQTKEFGCDLEDVLIDHKYKLHGILNGISYDIFNPKTDKYIAYQYTEKSLKKKALNKEKLLKDLRLDENIEKPLFIFIGRFVGQKGIDLLIHSLELIKELDATFIILGEGDKVYNEFFKQRATWYPNIYVKLGYDEAFARQLYASADFLLMPSIFEPCGLNQMISMKYGTIPIVAKTGGLADSIQDMTVYHKQEDVGIGISFSQHNRLYFLQAIAKALSLYSNKKELKKVIKYNMKVNNSWSELSKEYLRLYQA